MRPFHLATATLLAALVLCVFWFVTDRSAAVVQARGAGESSSATANAEDALANEAANAQNSAHSSREALLFGPTPEERARTEAERKLKAARRVEGRVVDAASHPIAGATVWATTNTNWVQLPLDVEPDGLANHWIKLKKATTDIEGRFFLEGLEPGPLRVAARAGGFAPAYLDHLDLPKYERHSIGDVVLEQGVSVSGRVIGPDGEGFAGANILIAIDCVYRSNIVALPGRGVPGCVSAADGSFVVDQLEAGPWHLLVEADGFVLSECNGRIERVGQKETGVIVRLERGYSIQGKLVCKDVAPPSGVRIGARLQPVEVENEEKHEALVGMEAPSAPKGGASKDEVRTRYGVVQEDGSFTIEGLKAGANYRLTATKKSADDSYKGFSAVEPQTVVSGTRNVQLVFRPESVLTFRVVDDVTSEPITELVVYAGIGRERVLRDDKGEVVHTFAEGRVRYPELRIPFTNTRPIPLRVSASGYKDHENKNVGLKPASELDLGDIRLQREHVVVAKVVDAETGAVVEDARVVLSATHDADDLREMQEAAPETLLLGDTSIRVARTGADGIARVTAIPGKNVLVVASAKGFRPSRAERALLPMDADHTLELKLEHGGSVIVKVTDGRGNPVSGVGVQHRFPRKNLDDENTEGPLKSDAEGLVHFDALASGRHGFQMHEDNGDVYFWDERGSEEEQQHWTEVGVEEGKTATVEFVAPPRGDVFGVVREGGRLIEGAHIKFVPRQPGEEKQGQAYWGGATDPFSTVSGHDGGYKIEHLRCGEYSALVMVGRRRMAAEFRLRVTPEKTQHDFDLDISGIEGHVVDPDGRPLAGLDVNCWRTKGGLDIDSPYHMVVTEDDRGNMDVNWEQVSGGQIKTDESGRYVIPGLVTNEPLVVNVQGEWVENGQSPEITLSPGEVRHGVDFTLRMAGKIQIDMANAGNGNRRDSWYLVKVWKAEDKEAQSVHQTYVGGWNRSNTISSIVPGHYKLSVRRHGDESAPAVFESEVDVQVGAVARVSFDPAH